MATPKRIQRKRTKGWKMPIGAVYVGRPTKWGNPFRIGSIIGLNATVQTVEDAIARYRRYMDGGGATLAWIASRELRGKDLACWCPIISHDSYVHCHADVLLSLANDIPIEDVIRENTRRAKGETL